MKHFDLSIIIPCYNEGPNIASLELALFSIVKQLSARQTLEVILVDDGSTDDTAARLRALAARHPAVVTFGLL